jgi:hypothetical protein
MTPLLLWWLVGFVMYGLCLNDLNKLQQPLTSLQVIRVVVFLVLKCHGFGVVWWLVGFVNYGLCLNDLNKLQQQLTSLQVISGSSVLWYWSVMVLGLYGGR